MNLQLCNNVAITFTEQDLIQGHTNYENLQWKTCTFKIHFELDFED